MKLTYFLFCSPPPEIEMQEHRRSRRDMSPQGRKRAAVMTSRDKMISYQPPRKVSCLGQIQF
jgi:regulating synaptic membrane exocytosis protein 2